MHPFRPSSTFENVQTQPSTPSKLMTYFPHADRIDSRDIIETIRTHGVIDWESVEIETNTENGETLFRVIEIDGETAPFTDWDADALQEVAELRHALQLMDDASEEGPNDGIGLIAADDFKSYAQELAEDIGAIDADAAWPTRCIDWDQAARELASDYTTVTIDGTDYYVR